MKAPSIPSIHFHNSSHSVYIQIHISRRLVKLAKRFRVTLHLKIPRTYPLHTMETQISNTLQKFYISCYAANSTTGTDIMQAAHGDFNKYTMDVVNRGETLVDMCTPEKSTKYSKCIAQATSLFQHLHEINVLEGTFLQNNITYSQQLQEPSPVGYQMNYFANGNSYPISLEYCTDLYYSIPQTLKDSTKVISQLQQLDMQIFEAFELAGVINILMVVA